MADGRVSVGSRVPVRGLPSWVTLEVLRGGFATGNASAQVPLQADEIALARRLGIPPARRLIFGYFLTDAGLQDLYELLDSGAYRVEIPEDAALLTVAWLVRAGDREAALDILDVVSPFAEKFRLAPKIANAPTSPPEFVYRITVGEAASALRARKPNHRVEMQREALAVWNPFGELSGAVAQSQGTVQLTVERLINKVEKKDDEGFTVPAETTYLYRPRSYVVIGQLSEFVHPETGGRNEAMVRSFELYRRKLHEPVVITFDELLARAEALVATHAELLV